MYREGKISSYGINEVVDDNTVSSNNITVLKVVIIQHNYYHGISATEDSILRY